MSHASGMAASIRAASESETFDLAGHSKENITATITDAFTEPLPLNEMVRITFITGAGKLGRQKYDENAAKAVTSALRALDYDEDRAASCVVECGGTFKSQHDTGKNLKTIVVFPKIIGGGAGDGNDALEGGVGNLSLDSPADQSLLPAGTPEHMVGASSVGVFERNWLGKCPSWAQKKGCLKALESVKATVDKLDAKLLQGTPLTDAEQDLYDLVSTDDLATKEAMVKKAMHEQVEGGNLTKLEKDMLLQQVKEKIDALNKEIDEAKKEKKPKRVDKVTAMREKALARQKMLEDIYPKAPHRLKHEPEIMKLRAEMRPLQKLEDSAKGRLLTVKETTALGRKDEILEQIAELEEASRGWFEDDEAFAARVEAGRAAVKAKEKQKVTRKPTAGSSGGGFKTKPINFKTPATRQAPAKPKKKGTSGGGVFAAMMMDSDSDSD